MMKTLETKRARGCGPTAWRAARTVSAVRDFDLIQGGDRILVAMSGGKDSYGMLHLLVRLRERAAAKFELLAVNLDQGQPGFPAHVLGWPFLPP